MNGINSHTHDPICRGEYQEAVTLTNCDVCNERFWTDSLRPFQDDEKVCEACIHLIEEQDKKETDFERGRSSLAIELLENLEGDTRKIVSETISRLQA